MPVKIERILVATDFSPAGHRAVGDAAEWARRTSAQLRIVHVIPPRSWLRGAWFRTPPPIRMIEKHAAQALTRLAQAVDPARALELSTGLLSGNAARAILRAAKDFQANLLVVGARGEGETTLRERGLGGTSTKLLAGASTPLLLVRRTPEESPPSVVAALDLSSYSAEVLAWALVAAAGGQLYAYHAYEVPFAARLEMYGLATEAIDIYSADEQAKRESELARLVMSAGTTIKISRVLERGDPARQLCHYIQALEPSLVTLGKHVSGASKSSSSSVGSVCQYIAQSSATNVLVVPPAAGT